VKCRDCDGRDIKQETQFILIQDRNEITNLCA
jgi:hypothetical protein